MDTIKSELKKLKNKINYHNHCYYNLDAPLILDEEYDNLMRRLIEIENLYPDLKDENSPTQKVGGKVLESFESIEHSIAMLSLDNAFSKGDILDFDLRMKKLLKKDDIKYTLEPKMDGLAIEIVYKDGNFSFASTRGDGTNGELVTENVRTIKNIPLAILGEKIPSLLEIRGEVIIETSDFIKLNEDRKKKALSSFANPRNAASGSIRQLDSKLAAKRPLKFFAYGIGLAENFAPLTQKELLLSLKDFGFKINPLNKYQITIDELFQNLDELAKTRNSLDYEIDGAVIKVDDISYQKELGEKTKSPRWAIAYKFASQGALSKVLDIKVQIGRTGAITPIATLSPVKIGGVMVQKASLHNEDEIKRLDIRVGDYVYVKRAGDVIPQVAQVYKEKRDGTQKTFIMPKVCPSCDFLLVKDKTKDGSIQSALRCPNVLCPAIIEAKIIHFVSKKAFNIDKLGKKLVAKFIEAKLISDYKDIFKMEIDDIKNLENMGEKSAQNIIDSIDASKKIDLANFIYALGIRHIGAESSSLLAKQYKDIKKLFDIKKEELEKIDQIGEIVAASVSDFFNDDAMKKTIEDLLEAGVEIYFKEQKDYLKGQSFVVTGSLKRVTRDQIKKLIEDAGGKLSSSLSKKTSYLIAGDNVGSKFLKAQQLGVQIISEDEFFENFTKSEL